MQLILEALTLSYDDHVITGAMNASFKAKDLCLITGQNGSGKTTFLRTIAGLKRPYKGKISLKNQDEYIHYNQNGWQTHFHCITQQDGLKKSLTILENMHMTHALMDQESYRKYSKKEHETIYLKALDLFALSDYAHQAIDILSKGQRQKVNLAKLIYIQRPLWLLDEPATALDKTSIATLNNLIQNHCKRGNLALIATHQNLDLKETMRINLHKEQEMKKP